MKTWEVEIFGVTPLLWNRRNRQLVKDYEGIKKDALDVFEEETWLRRCEEIDSNDLKAHVPEDWLHTAIIDGCKKTRIVPHFATSKNQTYTFYMESVWLEVIGTICNKKDLRPYGTYVRIGGRTGGLIWRIRPVLDKWALKFQIKDPDGRINKKELNTILEYTGMFVGIGDGRKKRFGRFEVKSLKEKK